MVNIYAEFPSLKYSKSGTADILLTSFSLFKRSLAFAVKTHEGITGSVAKIQTVSLHWWDVA